MCTGIKDIKNWSYSMESLTSLVGLFPRSHWVLKRLITKYNTLNLNQSFSFHTDLYFSKWPFIGWDWNPTPQTFFVCSFYSNLGKKKWSPYLTWDITHLPQCLFRLSKQSAKSSLGITIRCLVMFSLISSMVNTVSTKILVTRNKIGTMCWGGGVRWCNILPKI